jgi:Tfp pilus assembly protein PilN
MKDIPAFPVPSYVNKDGETHDVEFKGMTLRDYFAAKAMQAMLSSPEFLVVVTVDQAIGNNAKERVSNVSFAYADAMMKARSEA